MVYYRKETLATGEIYHVFSRSIAGFRIFNGDAESGRLIEAMRFFQKEKAPMRFFKFIELRQTGEMDSDQMFEWSRQEHLVQICAYCIMPTHIHIILKQLKENGISTFMRHVLNSYARYLNSKLKRKGPLWENSFKNVLVQTDEQLLHLTRYLHINPTTAGLVEKPEDWYGSSYHEYLSKVPADESVCEFDNVLNIEPDSYREFVEDQISYQRDIAVIKKLTLE